VKHWDHTVPAEGVDLGVWMAAQADPEIVFVDANSLVVDFPCWEPRSRGDLAAPQNAPYSGRLRFSGVQAHRVLDGELGPYRMVRGNFADPECLFEVRLSEYDASTKMAREPSWLPSVRHEHDPRRWFARLDAWNPKHAPPPDLPHLARHFIVDGRNSYVEVLSEKFEFERVPRVAA
jgi:hypothetical protein